MNKWAKTAIAALIILSVMNISWIRPTASAAVNGNIKVVLDDIPLSVGVSPVVVNNVTLVPFRAIANALGISAVWDGKAKAVRAQGEVNGVTKKVVLWTGQKKAEVDGKTVMLLAAPIIVNQQVLIPLNFFSSQFGATVGWSGATKTVTIVSPKKAMHLRAFYAMGSFSQRDRIASMDSVAFGWTRINENGELVLDGADYNWPKAAGEVTPESLVKDTSSQGVRPYLMVYSVDSKGELTKMLSDETLRSRSIENIVKLAQDNSFGGVLLDFEGLGLKLDPLGQQKLLNDYARLLEKELTAIHVKLSLAVPPPNSEYKGYDYKTLATLADDLVVMAYDYNPKGTPDHTPEPNAKVEEAIKMMLAAGVPNNKLILGINLWNETTATVDDKLGLAKRYGLKGASFWRLTFYGPDIANAIDRVVVKVGE
jgi:spore germination protein YaaH